MVSLFLYTVTDDPRTVDKTLDNQTSLQLSGILRVPTDVLNPVVTIDYDPASTVTTYNYAYIVDLRRYYFIADYKIVNNKLVELSLKVDVLKTYSTEIKALPAFVERNEYEYDELIEDVQMPTVFTKTQTQQVLPSDSTCVNFTDYTAENSRFICVTALVASDSVTLDTVPDLMFDYPNVWATPNDCLIYLTTTVANTKPTGNLMTTANSPRGSVLAPKPLLAFTYLLTVDDYQKMCNVLMAHENVKTYIYGVVAMPYIQASDYTEPTPYLMDMIIGDVKCGFKCPISRRAASTKYIIHKRGTFPIRPASYLDIEPYKRYSLFLPYVGKVDLPSSLIPRVDVDASREFIIYYAANLMTGAGCCYVRFYGNKSACMTFECQLGMQLAVDSSNQLELNNQRKTAAINGTLGFLSSLFAIGIGGATGNPLAMAGGVLTAARTIGSLVSTNINLVDRADVHFVNTEFEAYDTNKEAYLIETHTSKVIGNQDMDDFAHQFGRPLRQIRVLSTVNGYTVVGTLHLDSFTATNTEKNEIEQLLKSGVLFPAPTP